MSRYSACTAAILVLTACGGGSSDPVVDPPSVQVVDPRSVQVEIQRTAFGVPHIVGQNPRSAAYGLAYAYAQDNVCLIADRFLTVAGERSKYLGGETKVSPTSTLSNLESDFFYRHVLDQPTLDKAFNGNSETAQDLIAGYVAGYNRFIAEAKASDMGECATASWARRPLTENELRRHLLAVATQSGYGGFVAAIVAAVPPVTKVAAASARRNTTTLAQMQRRELAQLRASAAKFAKEFDERPMGSNGQAFGSEVTNNGRGVLIANPHFPWSGPTRFYQSHIEVPGKFNVMGAGLGGVPLQQIGFNNDVAWTNTVSTGRRFTLFELQLNGMNYVVDGVSKPLLTKQVSVDVLSNGIVTPQTRTFYSSEHGPLLVSSQIGAVWTATKAFVIRDANVDNGRSMDQTWEMGQATSAEQLRQIIGKRMGMPWVNTLAADRSGQAFYADYSVTPNVSAAQLATCATSPQAQALAATRVFLLDGSRASCNWAVDPTSAAPGIMAATTLPALSRRDYVSNSNESAWLTNPAQPLTGFSPLVGDQAKTQSLRSRMAITQVQERLAGTDGLVGNKISSDNLETVFFQGRVMSAELVLPALLGLCQNNSSATATNGTVVDLKPACSVLAQWDKRAKISSVGTPVFREFWRRAQAIPGLFGTPFSAQAPWTTPRDPAVSTPAVADAMVKALADGVLALRAAGVSLDAPLGKVQYVTRNGINLAIDGGDEFEGVYNKMTPPGLTAGGYTSFVSGGSYIQIVSFEADGVKARGLLTYSQATQVASPHFADYTEQLSRGQFVKLPYTRAEIAADPQLGAKLVLTAK